MEIFEYIIMLLGAVLLSNLINKFLPTLSVPIVQIILGVFITVGAGELFHSDFEFSLNPELFFVLFLAPLVFQATMQADMKMMRSMAKPIILAAVALVFVTIFLAGYLTYLHIAAIDVAIAMMLIAALGPTDVVAVEAVVHRVHLHKKIVSILVGESIINDATGIVCFQFALIAVKESRFNPLEAAGSFLILAIGGIIVGIVITMLKYALVRWLRSLNMSFNTLHISLGILTPFIVYLAAESVHTSGILAVFGAGLCHSIFKDTFNPETVKLSNANDSVWGVLSFSLDGLVFVMLGTQLPQILHAYMVSGVHEITGLMILGYVMVVFLLLAVIRFLWWILTVKQSVYNDPETPEKHIKKVKAALIFSIAGARGAVPMASIMSIPLFLPDEITHFPHRDLLILIASGVIVVSLLMTNFVLPLLAEEPVKKSPHDTDETEAKTEILQTVIKRLKESANAENYIATQIIMRNYYSRINQQPKSGKKKRNINALRQSLLIGEKELLLHMREMEQISKQTAEHHICAINELLDNNDKKMNIFQILVWYLKHFIETLTWKETKQRKKELFDMKRENTKIMKKRLKELDIPKDDPLFALISEEHEKVMSSQLHISNGDDNSAIQISVAEIASNAFYMEQILIQQMMEAGRLSLKTAKEMQANIIMIEAQMITK